MTNDLGAMSIPGIATFETGAGGLDLLAVATPSVQARLFLHGAQLTNWHPAGTAPVLFVSDHSVYESGRAIRGGVPVCAPWFGPRDGAQAHGFFRNRVWEAEQVTLLDDGRVQAVLILRSDDDTRAMWPHDFVARVTYTIGAQLQMELCVANTSRAPFVFTEAFHTYFSVGDVRRVRVEGLDGTEYRDFPVRTQLSRQDGAVTFGAETDRVYVNTPAECVLVDPSLEREIVIAKTGSRSTVVWNPWADKARSMADLGDDEWPTMLCIETANAWENAITLAPGESHRMTARVSVETRAAKMGSGPITE